jgi:hypothetical protein
LALVPSGWTGGAEFHLPKAGRVVESHQVDELESFIDLGWTPTRRSKPTEPLPV